MGVVAYTPSFAAKPSVGSFGAVSIPALPANLEL